MKCFYILHFFAATKKNSEFVSSSNVALIQDVSPAFILFNAVQPRSYLGPDTTREKLRLGVDKIAKKFSAELIWETNDPSRICFKTDYFANIIAEMRKLDLIRKYSHSDRVPYDKTTSPCLSKLSLKKQKLVPFSSAKEKSTANMCSRRQLVLLVRTSKAIARGEHACPFVLDNSHELVVKFDVPLKARMDGITTKFIKQFKDDKDRVLVHTTNKLVEYKKQKNGIYYPVTEHQRSSSNINGGMSISAYISLFFDEIEDSAADVLIGCAQARTTRRPSPELLTNMT
ncbi:hypothetical protein GcC1_100029 [Golovinomyces cichoracearum]|uniref:Uncharacterized protein n=1 Tax=Golovinomyces cichoracearum TaxID=62708 RepID=A0A420IA39_9PEZI|nr:hypothetical protein GcC1_100029 [Golovinomyces cichoracearum]